MARPLVPQLSVLIVNHCQWPWTAALTRRLLGSSAGREGAVEVLIVDNHSPPHPLSERLRRRRGVRLVQGRRNHGYARAVNAGVHRSRADWLLVLNPDVRVADDFAEEVLRFVERLADAPRLGIVGFRLRHADGSPQLSCGRFPTLARTLFGLLRPRARRKYQDVHLPGPVDWVSGCCLLLRRECLRQLAGFDENFFLYYEDADLCRRALQHGWKVHYEPSLTVVHQRPLHTRSVPPLLRLITRHGLLTYAARHWPAWQRWLLGGIVRAESLFRRLRAHWSGDRQAADLFAELEQLSAAAGRGEAERVQQRLAMVLRRYGRDLQTVSAPDVPGEDRRATIHCDPQLQPPGFAGPVLAELAVRGSTGDRGAGGG